MDSVALLRQQYQLVHSLLEGTVADLAPEQAHWAPPGVAMPIAAEYAHVLSSEDGIVNGILRGAPPLSATDWAGRTGLSEPPPLAPPWAEWAGRVRVDLAAAREYGRAVYASTDAFLAGLTADDLDRASTSRRWASASRRSVRAWRC